MSHALPTRPLRFGFTVGLYFSAVIVCESLALAEDQDKSKNQRQNQSAQQQAQRAQQQAQQQQAQQQAQQRQQQQMQEQQRRQQAQQQQAQQQQAQRSQQQAQQRQLQQQQQQAQQQQAQKVQIQQQQSQEQQRVQRERQQAQQRLSQQQAQQQQIQQMQFQEQQKAQRERQQGPRLQQQAQQQQAQQPQQQQVQKVQIQQQQDQQKDQKVRQQGQQRAQQLQQQAQQKQQQQAEKQQIQKQQAQQQLQEQQKAQRERQQAQQQQKAQKDQQQAQQQTQQNRLQQQQVEQQKAKLQQAQKQKIEPRQQTGQTQQQPGRGNNQPMNPNNVPNGQNRLNQPGNGGGNLKDVTQGNPLRNQGPGNNRNQDLNQHLKQFQPPTVAQPGKEPQHIRNRDHVEKLLRDNPKLKTQIQKPDGKVDLAKLHLQHDTKNRIANVVHKNGDLPLNMDRDQDLHKQFQHHGNIKNLDDLNRRMNHFRDPEVMKRHPELARMDFKNASGHFQNQLAQHHFDNLAGSRVGQQLQLQQQFHNYQHGDVARRMNLQASLINHGGWRNRYTGPLYPGYTQNSFSSWYCGPGQYPKYCWTPRWSPWVDWCWWNTCPVIYDPRPIDCRPIVSYAPSPTWVVNDYPAWQPLAEVSSGTWVDLPQPVLVDNIDVRLIAVRFVDSGHSEEDLGTRYRIWFENQSRDQITSPFNVMLLAGNTPQASADLPQAGVTVPSMEAGETQVVDIRLPFSANKMNREGESLTPFGYLHVLIDSHQQLADINRTNNGAVLARTDILPVDPAAFAPDVSAAAPNALVSIAGEGFGPEPGRVIIDMNGTQTEPTIFGWYDLGVQFELPNAPISEPTNAEVLVIRGDGAASNPVTLRIAPLNKLEQAALPTPMP